MNRCLEKSYPKDLPSIGVVLIYLNEALSVIKRAMRSIIDRTPKNLLKEIIMVDDNSSNGWLVGWLVTKAWYCAKPRLLKNAERQDKLENCVTGWGYWVSMLTAVDVSATLYVNIIASNDISFNSVDNFISFLKVYI